MVRGFLPGLIACIFQHRAFRSCLIFESSYSKLGDAVPAESLLSDFQSAQRLWSFWSLTKTQKKPMVAWEFGTGQRTIQGGDVPCENLLLQRCSCWFLAISPSVGDDPTVPNVGNCKCWTLTLRSGNKEAAIRWDGIRSHYITLKCGVNGSPEIVVHLMFAKHCDHWLRGWKSDQ